MNSIADIFTLLKKATKILLSRPAFFVLGLLIITPQATGSLFLEYFPFEENLSQESFSNIPVTTLIIFLGVALFSFIASLLGTVLVILMTHHGEKETPSNTFSLIQTLISKKTTLRVWTLFRLEVVIGFLLLGIGLVLTLPGILAQTQGISSLSRGLFLSAFGIFISLAFLFHALRQYATLYITLSSLSLRASLEAAVRLFRARLRATVLFVGILLFINSVLFLSTSMLPDTLLWYISFPAFSLFEAWSLISWTLFFRMIALPKDPEAVARTEEAMVQQKQVAELDKI
ncbi:MAG: hypothetical protein IPL87_00765 [Candidatus Moraniibacteriota bacterium]|nr:MAG: hypothetical protein IPL87_00765 [Candidatus Moranbacteria bacterium]